jgi:hypothetical protein
VYVCHTIDNLLGYLTFRCFGILGHNVPTSISALQIRM